MRLIFILFFLFQLFTVFIPAQNLQETKFAERQSRETEYLTLGTPLIRQLNGGATDKFSLKAEAGQAVLITVEQRKIDVIVGVYHSASENEKINEIDFSLGVDGTERLFFVAPKTGDYRIEIRSLVKNAVAGEYQIQLLEQRLATARDLRENLAAERFFCRQYRAEKTHRRILQGSFKTI
jgi:hypothetical protein